MKNILSLALLLSAPVQGSMILSGLFGQDDQVQWFSLSLVNAGTLTVVSTGYQSGGFDPILSLFGGGPAGQFMGQLLAVATDSIPLSLALPSGTYALALTQYDNFAVGPTAADGFSRDGQGNFTPSLSGFPGVKFLDQAGSQRTGQWILTFDGASAQAVPEPGTFVGLAPLLWLLLRSRTQGAARPGARRRGE
ncbi:MAG: DVUA0089 family protein [Bryobacteraceae bacterium]|nr:DVUA0089 family protein [Bryobacteraceae bacterium]